MKFKNPLPSFFSRKFYRQVVSDWQGVGFIYLLLVILVTQIVPAIRFQLRMNEGIPLINRAYSDKLPTLIIKDGELSMDEPSPLRIGGPPWMIFDFREDTTPETTQKSTILITRSGISFSDIHGNQIPVPLDLPNQATPASLDLSKFFREKLRTFQLLAIPIFLMMAVPCGFVFCATQCLVLATVSKLVFHLRRIETKFHVLIRLAAVALGPVLFIDMIWGVLDAHAFRRLVLKTLVTGIILLCYTVLAMSSIDDTKPDGPLTSQ